jgi:D-3-phosphoglycerate dehydrogenase
VSNDPVTYVNAPQRAKDHGLELREVSSTISDDYVNLVTVRGGGHTISGTLHWRRSEQRIVLVDGHTFDVPPVDHMVMITNDDRPGVIGTVGTLLGNAGINIADMDVGRSERPGLAVMLIAPTSVVEQSILDALRAAPGIVEVVALNS